MSPAPITPVAQVTTNTSRTIGPVALIEALPDHSSQPRILTRPSTQLTVVPACMLRVFNVKEQRVKALPVDLGVKIRPVALFTLKNRTLNPVADIVIKCMRDVSKSFRWHAR
jgi:hypothetical protein